MQNWQAAFQGQATNCAALGSPFTARICRLMATNLQSGTLIAQRIMTWTGDISSNGASVPLRFCGALHSLKRAGNPKLAAVYPPHTVSDDVLWEAIQHSMEQHETDINSFMDSPPQTNEVRRSAALIAAGHFLNQHFELPIIGLELGASAGLNLNWPDYGLVAQGQYLGAPDPLLTLTPDWRGAIPIGKPAHVVQRRGVDLNPLDPQRDADRLFSYLWPDQPERLELTQAAIAAAKSDMVARGDAVDWLQETISPVSGHLRLVYHTIAWQYFPLNKKQLGQKLICDAGASASNDTPLAWLALEPDTQGPGAALTLRIWPRDIAIALARVDFHGRWITWQAGETLVAY